MDHFELLEPFERMLEALFTPHRVRLIERGDAADSEWSQIEESGFLEALRPEREGGAGLLISQVLPLFLALGRHAVPLPIGEAMLAHADQQSQEEKLNGSAVLRSAQIAGAAERVLGMSIAYANERVQFGKPIARQQAIQQQLAVMAEDTVSVRIAAELAVSRGWPTTVSAAIAKSVASSAATRIANTAHAVHGAIGISAEYDLQLYTRRMHAWRVDGGAEAYWNRRIGEAVLASRENALDWVRATVFQL